MISNTARVNSEPHSRCLLDVRAEDARAVTTSSGAVVKGDIQVKRRALATIEDTRIDGNIQLEENGRELSSSRAVVRGDFQVFKNRGGVTLNSNRISQNLQCKENSPAPTGSGNIAGEKEDQCRRL